MKIYTKTGDSGETGILGSRLSKNSALIQTIGDIDELNSTVGICLSVMDSGKNQELKQGKKFLLNIQSTLFSINSILANANLEIDLDREINNLEEKIDEMSESLEELKNFILPGGSLVSSSLHFARTVCRRAERNLVNYLENDNKDLNEFCLILKYINRLSDYLFTLARWTNSIEGNKDIVWKIRKK